MSLAVVFLVLSVLMQRKIEKRLKDLDLSLE
jgi:hypothetical protein